jgi:hypothetical protein
MRHKEQNHRDGERLLEIHNQHRGVYARVAQSLGISASYVSLVATGKRNSDKVRTELIRELRKITN